MSDVGQRERLTQNRVVALFRDQLKYTYLGNWEKRHEDNGRNRNVDSASLTQWLAKQGITDSLIKRALYEFDKAVNSAQLSLYDRNKAVYELLRYGVKVKPDIGENTVTVWLIDWKNPLNNDFGIAEEVTVKVANPAVGQSRPSPKRPDIVLFVNGIALGVLELKRSTVSVSEGIRQNLDNQRKEFIEPFFSTMQLVMAGSDTQGLRYGTIQTKEKYYLEWKEDCPPAQQHFNRLDQHLLLLCDKTRFLELIHDFVVFDSGTKKFCRQNQYFGVRAAQRHIQRREGGIIWHTQGSGKSLTMVWLAKWIHENIPPARILIITDRTELDEQIEKVFKGVNEEISRAKSGAELIAQLNDTRPWLMCSLIHKFGGKEEGEEVGDIAAYIEEVKKSLPTDFAAKGDLYVFVDECHRTQSGELHKAMKSILPNALFIGFTGTPLLKADKQKSIEIFGSYIHTYKFNEAVKDGVVLDLRYEARDIDQSITSTAKIDQWFAAKTKGLTDLAKAQLKARWGTMKKVLSSQSRLEKIVSDILMDMEVRDRLASGRGNAMLVTSSIFEACKCYELFAKAGMGEQCAIVTSYKPSPANIKGESTGEGLTEKLRQYDIYNTMLAGKDPELFEKEVKKKFIDEPGQMRLLIVVDKLLTGFDAPSATYLYIDKKMRDHGLFQAICRVNRLDGDDKQYGFIVDYQDLFKRLEDSIGDYTSGALDGYDQDDVKGLLEDRLSMAKSDLQDAREAIKALCEPVAPPKDGTAYQHYFCGNKPGDAEELKLHEAKRLALYKLTSSLVRSYANVANELAEAGYSPKEIASIKGEVDFYEKLRQEIKMYSGDAIDMKLYEPGMRHLIDSYIRAEESTPISDFDDMPLIQLIVERGTDALAAVPKGLRSNENSMAETIENNVRKLIIDETPINPKYYETMSSLLDALIEQRRNGAIAYQEYLAEVVALAKKVAQPSGGTSYPTSLDTSAKRALFDNLHQNEALALHIHKVILKNKQDDFRNSTIKQKKIRIALRTTLEAYALVAEGVAAESTPDYLPQDSDAIEALVTMLLELAKHQHEY
ncbi:type I restriction endonuclease subunit R [Deefgea piscis]|uniref:type I restriction endonuclease subunit R n=1 Tax=Deefgea piscis TaxID=2739061 RepID=UPI001C81FC29|nr:HsdR family type I site-specific deoxyribonuclease [Deefgea piscis]QZA82561.1 HsdR family type I site-specific deoxyribonuclease [Deefgea piscis]